MKTVIKVTAIILVLGGLAAGIFWAALPRQRSSVYLWIADKTAQSGDASAAAKLYEDAVKADPLNDEARLAAVGFYRSGGNYTKVEFHLLGGIKEKPGNPVYYTELSRIYVEQGKLYDASGLLDSIDNEVIKKNLAVSRPQPPEILPESGNYSGTLTIGVKAPEGLKIYCSADGDFPTADDLYTGEITAQPGDTEVTAVCIDKNGLVSPPASASYRLELDVAAVAFEDPGVEKVIRTILDKPAGDISSSELRAIREFSNSLGGETVRISSAADLKWCPDLQMLELTEVPSALSCIEYLPSLKILALRDCGISDPSPISGLTQLELLDLSQNSISSVASLSALPGLETLVLRHNSVVDIAPLGCLSSLVLLDAGENAISDIGSLKSCANLESLALDSNKISDISSVGSMTHLITLEISDNEIADISPLASCTALQTLSCSDNKIEVTDALRSCAGLNSITASKNNISDITPLGGLINLTVLDLSENLIQNAEPLSGCAALKNLDISENFIPDVSALGTLQNLTELNIEHNMIKDISKLASCQSLETVYAFGNQIKSIEALENAGITVYK